MARSVTTLVETAQPVIAPFGILSSATTVVEGSDDSWISGLTHEVPDARVSARNVTILGSDNENSVTAVSSPVKDNYRFYYPFDVQTSIEVSTMGSDPAHVLKSAKSALDVVAQKTIEFEFWEGGIAKTLTDPSDNRYLANSSAIDMTPTPGTGVKVHYGLALLEEALGTGTIGSTGVIHAPRSVASALRVRPEKGTLCTSLGTSVVAGTGYTRRGPSGALAPANQAWMYATGPVTVRLGQVTVIPEKLSQAVDTSINNIKYYVDRPASVTWSTTNLYAVLVDLTLDYQ